ncbi:YiiD C-terminal domain-containing protein [Wenzhouxiangella sp. EGI_FJ10305]|uniref:YiiD C-terminal domain-containing protein n=1 Tax=Wenzhouxiangella sp. EGI_FJ10305 TaxID=3243768 RepID=UPI0035D5500E
MDIEIDEAAWLERTLTDDIPLGGAMKLTVSQLDETGVELTLPLAPSINDKGTAFGGALASAMILAGWSLPRLLLRRAGIDADLVIGRCDIRFVAPVGQSFRAACRWPDEAATQGFLVRLRERGRASLVLEPELRVGNEVAATLSAKYAALMRDSEGKADA